MRTKLAMLGIALAAAMLAGCSPGMMMSGGKMAYQVMEGAEAKVRPLQDVSTAALEPYRSIRLGELTTDLPGPISASDLDVVRTEMAKELESEKTHKRFPGEGKTLVAGVTCRFLKERGTFGGEARLDMIVTLTDAETHEELGRLFIEGLSKSPVAGKAKNMAKENGAELVKYLAKKQKGEKGD